MASSSSGNTRGLKRRSRDSDSSLLSLLHSGGISRSGLHELLTKLKGSDVLENGTTIYRLRKIEDDLFKRFGTKLVVPTVDEGEFTWEFIDPNKYLVESVHRRARLQALFADAIRNSPPTAETPWHLVIGFDEYVPGKRRTCFSLAPLTFACFTMTIRLVHVVPSLQQIHRHR